MESKYSSFVSSKNYDISNRKRPPLSSEASKIKDLPYSLANSTFQPTTYFQSTPKGKSSITNPVTLMNGSLPRSPSTPGRRSVSPVHQRSTSPTKLHLSGGSISPRQLLDVDTDTIQKQRRELQLLIMELKDRDRELNDMVQTHQKHLHAWDEDRQRILALERRCARLEGMLSFSYYNIYTSYTILVYWKFVCLNEPTTIMYLMVQLNFDYPNFDYPNID